MSRLDELMAELCPDGVPCRTSDSLASKDPVHLIRALQVFWLL